MGEAFLNDMGLSPAPRQEAARDSYGAGSQMQRIKQEGNMLTVENTLKKVRVNMQFRINGGEQLTVDQSGKPLVVNPRWEGQRLVIPSKREDGTKIATSQRYMDGDTMVLEFMSPKGTVVQRHFAQDKT